MEPASGSLPNYKGHTDKPRLAAFFTCQSGGCEAVPKYPPYCNRCRKEKGIRVEGDRRG